jgi:hypothetical protein
MLSKQRTTTIGGEMADTITVAKLEGRLLDTVRNTKERATGAINVMIDAVKPMTETLGKTYLLSEEDLADWYVEVVTASAEADGEDDWELSW